MALAVVGVKVVIIAMLLLTTMCTAPSHQQRYQHASNHQASTVHMESIQMASLWSHGKVESCWCGMRHALTPLHHRTHQGPPMRQGLWLLKRKTGRKSNIHTSHAFIPVAIETSGVFGVKTMRFVQELGQQLERVTGEVRSTNFLIQRLSVAVYTTWKLRIGAEHNGPFREFRLVLLFLRILCILICMRFNQRLNQVNERSESGLLWGRMRSGAGCTCIRGLLCACAGSSILSEQERKSCRGIRIQWHTKKRSNSGDILEFCHSLAALFFEPV